MNYTVWEGDFESVCPIYFVKNIKSVRKLALNKQ